MYNIKSAKSIPVWTLNIEEISNGVLKLSLTDAYGRKAERIEDASDDAIERAIGDAFDIEKQISQNWNLFLYELAIRHLSGKAVKIEECHEKDFGSWSFKTLDKRLVYEGKDSCLLYQVKIDGDRANNELIKKDELKYSIFITQIERLITNTKHTGN